MSLALFGTLSSRTKLKAIDQQNSLNARSRNIMIEIEFDIPTHIHSASIYLSDERAHAHQRGPVQASSVTC